MSRRGAAGRSALSPRNRIVGAIRTVTLKRGPIAVGDGARRAQLAPIRQPDGGEQPPALVADRPRHLDPFASQLGQSRRQVVAHQVRSVRPPSSAGWTPPRRRRREDQPAVTRASTASKPRTSRKTRAPPLVAAVQDARVPPRITSVASSYGARATAMAAHPRWFASRVTDRWQHRCQYDAGPRVAVLERADVLSFEGSSARTLLARMGVRD